MKTLLSYALTLSVIALLSVLLATVTANSWNASQAKNSTNAAVYKIDLTENKDK